MVTVKEKAVRKAKRFFRFLALLANETMDVITALELYCNKDVVEKAFGNLKERLNMRHTLVSSEQSLDGKLFVEFVALIYLSHIKKQMQETDLFKHYTMSGALDNLMSLNVLRSRDGNCVLAGLLRSKGIFIQVWGLLCLLRYEWAGI